MDYRNAREYLTQKINWLQQVVLMEYDMEDRNRRYDELQVLNYLLEILEKENAA